MHVAMTGIREVLVQVDSFLDAKIEADVRRAGEAEPGTGGGRAEAEAKAGAGGGSARVSEEKLAAIEEAVRVKLLEERETQEDALLGWKYFFGFLRGCAQYDLNERMSVAFENRADAGLPAPRRAIGEPSMTRSSTEGRPRWCGSLSRRGPGGCRRVQARALPPGARRWLLPRPLLQQTPRPTPAEHPRAKAGHGLGLFRTRTTVRALTGLPRRGLWIPSGVRGQHDSDWRRFCT